MPDPLVPPEKKPDNQTVEDGKTVPEQQVITAQINYLLLKNRETAGKLAQPETQVSPELNRAEPTPCQDENLKNFLD